MASINFRDDRRLSQVERGKLREFCGSLDSDIVELANALGIKVFVEDLLPYDKGYLEYDPVCGSKSNFKIVINQSAPIEVQRFTVAHELAHFLLHKEDAKRRKAHRVLNADLYDIFVYMQSKDKLHPNAAKPV
jgi:Zn-dependent peptidase ImmA (M78 family)